MAKIATPLYLLFPWVKWLVPQKQLICRIENLTSKFMDLLEHKRDPGNNMMTYMLKDPGMTLKELRDNMIVLFLGGHVSNISDAIATTLNSNKFQDTTAGSILTLFYFLACHPEIQVKQVFGDNQNPTVDLISGISLPDLSACIRGLPTWWKWCCVQAVFPVDIQALDSEKLRGLVSYMYFSCRYAKSTYQHFPPDLTFDI
ncbi:hypothetical protein D9758_015893 [Tetrapyrgos nigripes]|uniref:Cytochrome P450 n=1 Tax=Tetrapyrgos nigripes TaxID=182062 RepID=A0A8H5CN08_9AGAR|nr:hypothetical protein D9758_015893 [Tetrapyrgos nigripes]